MQKKQARQKIEGIITKVSGPLVIAEDIPGARMFDVVRVGDKKLIGEIIGLDQNRASVQVYEDTAGVGPGEKVETTGEPLSVELGPGIMRSIYDGIQRPLNLIFKESGAFIARGIEVPGIDRDKQWDFKPVVKKGDQVETGDILGTVQETELIEHKIMVPPGFSGKVSEISAGKFKVEDIVAKIETEKGVQEVTMLQRWPIRVPRPVKKNLPANTLMASGQRVLDTFFPLAQGGTASIPGPFGSGKCVVGSTPILLANGRIISLKRVFQEGEQKGKLLTKNSREEAYNIKELSNPKVISLDKRGFKVKDPITVYKGKTDSTIKISTRTGKSIELTPIHKLLVLDKGSVKQKQAHRLKKGDYLISPRRVSLKLKDQKIKVFDLLSKTSLFSCDRDYNKEARPLLKRFIKSDKRYKIWEQYLKSSRNIPLRVLTKLKACGLRGNPKEICSYHGKKILIPAKMNSEFAEFIGYLLADGNLKKSSYSLRFYNADRKVLDRFVYLGKKLFGLKPYLYSHPQGNLWIAQIDCKALFDLLVSFGFPTYRKSRNAFIPEVVLMSSDRGLAQFIGAYIACDGSIDVKGGRIEINSASRRSLEEISFVLLRLGIVSSLEKKRKDGTSRLWINSAAEIKKLSRLIKIYGTKEKLLLKAAKRKSYSNIDAIDIPFWIQEILRPLVNTLRKKGHFIASYAYGNQKIGILTFQNLIRKLGKIRKIPSRLHAFYELTQEVFFDQISKIEEIDRKKDVFDLEVPQVRNFVGGHGALLLHNTVVQHQIAKWADAEIIIYCACGERGNEVTDVLQEFPELSDPKSGKKLMERTIIIANSSNMPVAAREASVYTAITLAEYYRDMGYKVALTADSTSRWAEALREMSGRLEEMPGEEGYPAYLGTRTAAFYERAGRVECLASDKRIGSLTVIGAVSPPGGDFSEPVTQNTLRVTKVFWALDSALAYKRHFPAINWLTSYSLYNENLKEYFEKEVAPDFNKYRIKAMELLQEEANLEEIVRLVGFDALGPRDQLILRTARMIREDFLHQNAFDEIDTYTSLPKQYGMLKIIIDFYNLVRSKIKEIDLKELFKKEIIEDIAKLKFVPEDKAEGEYKKVWEKVEKAI